MKTTRTRLSCGLAIGAVLATTAVFGAVPAQAASSDPLTPPAGWTSWSASNHWGEGWSYTAIWSWWLEMPDGSPAVANPQVSSERPQDSLFVDVFASTDRVTAAGDTIDFEMVLRRSGRDDQPQPLKYPGARFTDAAMPNQGWFSVNLAGLLDNVDGLTLADFTADSAWVDNLSLSGTTLSGRVSYLPQETERSITFSATYNGQGDAAIQFTANASQDFPSYGATVDLNVSIPIITPSFDVFKTADVSEVTDDGDEITYDVTITRPTVIGERDFTFTDDMSDVLKDARPFTAADITMPTELAGITPVVTSTGFTLAGAWPSNVSSATLSYTVTYDGASADTSLVNEACMTGIRPAAPGPGGMSPAVTEDPVCADAAVAVKQPAPVITPTPPVIKPTPPVTTPTPPVTPPVDPSTPPVDPPKPSVDVPTPPAETDNEQVPGEPKPSETPGASLAATGAPASGALATMGALLLAGGIALTARLRTRRRTN